MMSRRIQGWLNRIGGGWASRQSIFRMILLGAHRLAGRRLHPNNALFKARRFLPLDFPSRQMFPVLIMLERVLIEVLLVVKRGRTQAAAHAEMRRRVRRPPVLPTDMLPCCAQILRQEAGRAGLALHATQVGRDAKAARLNDLSVIAGPEVQVFHHVVEDFLPGNVLGGTAQALEDMLQMGGINMADEAGGSHAGRTEVALFAVR